MQHTIIEKINSAIHNNKLKGQEAHMRMVPPGRNLEIDPEDFHKVKQSAVLVLLYPNSNNDCMMCFIERPANMRTHAGQIGFPGGKFELTDPSFEHTALREAKEEVGIAPGIVKILGRLSSLYISVSHFLIHPVVGILEHTPQFNCNVDEVSRLLELPLKAFTDEDNFATHTIETVTGKLDVPCFKIEDEIIWGATAMIIAELLDTIR